MFQPKLSRILVLAGGTIIQAQAVLASTQISARLRRARSTAEQFSRGCGLLALGGNQPRFNTVQGNIVHHLGIYTVPPPLPPYLVLYMQSDLIILCVVCKVPLLFNSSGRS